MQDHVNIEKGNTWYITGVKLKIQICFEETDFKYPSNIKTYYPTLNEIINIQFVKQPTGLIDGRKWIATLKWEGQIIHMKDHSIVSQSKLVVLK